MAISDLVARYDSVEKVNLAILNIYLADGYFAEEKCMELYKKITAQLKEIMHTIFVEMDKELNEMSKQA